MFSFHYQGGLRAVVWTDALQVVVMVAAVVVITALGTYQVGGPSEIWHKALEAKRIQFLKYATYLKTPIPLNFA